MYSLINASTIGFDLVRLPGGEAVAGAMAQALCLRTADLVELDGVLPRIGPGDSARRQPAGSPSKQPAGSPSKQPVGSPSTVLQALRRVAAADGVSLLAVASGELSNATMGTQDELTDCLTHRWFEWHEPGAPPLSDSSRSVAAAAGELCLEQVLRAYHPIGASHPVSDCVAWRPVCALTSPRLAETLRQLGLSELVETVADLSSEQVGQLVEQHSRPRPGGSWAQALHSATWAVHLTGRVRAAAAAQLALVTALHRARLSTACLAAGVWNACSGLVQAAVVADLLDEQSQEALTGPYRAALRLH